MKTIADKQILELHRNGNKETKQSLEKIYPDLFNRKYERIAEFSIKEGIIRDSNGYGLNGVALVNLIGTSHDMLPGEGLFISYPIKRIELIEHGLSSTILGIKKGIDLKEKWC
jgi:hypothetical protein